MANKGTGADLKEVMDAFNMTDESVEKRIGIKDKIILPTPEEKPITIRLLWSKDTEGKPVSILKVPNEKFDKGVAYFMAAEYYENPGERQLSLGVSLTGSMAAVVKERKFGSFDDLIGKIGDIRASYYFAAPKSLRMDRRRNTGRLCSKCGGKGCTFCTVTGSGEDAGMVTGLQPPTVFSFVLRDDLMNVVGSGTKTSVENQF